MKILLTLKYKGTNFIGWQKQANGRSVQKVVEEVLGFLFGEKVELYGSGRTDSGVHALGQRAHFETTSEKFLKNFCRLSKNGSAMLNEKKLIDAINAHLPSDVKIEKARVVSETFHARFSVKEKVYEYRLQIGCNPLTVGLCGEVKTKPDLDLMKEGAKFLTGTHDFTSFSSSKTEVKDFVRTVNYIKIYMLKQDEVIFEISGNGFLYNMVRIIVGTLIEVGNGKISPKDVKTILEAKNRTRAGKTAKPEGLYLKKVIY